MLLSNSAARVRQVEQVCKCSWISGTFRSIPSQRSSSESWQVVAVMSDTVRGSIGSEAPIRLVVTPCPRYHITPSQPRSASFSGIFSVFFRRSRLGGVVVVEESADATALPRSIRVVQRMEL